ncbi:MAG: hypothetical protein ACRDSS_13375, partial [Actinocrinis sp.]
MSSKTLSRAFRTAPGKAALATGCAVAAVGALLAFPAEASTAPASANLVIKPTRSHDPLPSFSLPGLPSATAGQQTTAPPVSTVPIGLKTTAGAHRSSKAKTSLYVSTFTPAPPVTSAPAPTASVACLPNGAPITGSGGVIDLPGIAGGSKVTGHVGALPLATFGPQTMVAPQIDSADLAQLVITRPADGATANLAMVASSGYRFPCVHIEIGPGQGYQNMEYALVNAGLVADDKLGGTETMTWTYATILWTYTLPGSAKVHQGSGEINAQPDKVTTSLVTDSKKVAAATIGLAVFVALALVLLYIWGRHRNRKRYRQRYAQRVRQRADREAMEARAAVATAAMERAREAEMAREAQAARETLAEWEALQARRAAAEEAERAERVEREAREARDAAEVA